MTPPAKSFATLLTPPGAAAIAVVRITGPNLASFFSSHFSRPLAAMRCVHGELRDGDNVLDDPVVVLHEDQRTADINLHGGPWVVATILELLSRAGFDIIDELPDADAPLEQEVLAALPLARTEPAARMLLAQTRCWKGFINANPSPDAIRDVLNDVCLWRLLHLPRVAIIGSPNVGKSTLANRLFEQDRSITADLPGTTRDWIGEIANIDGLAVMLVDTPGLRQTEDFIEQKAIDQSRKMIEGSDLLLMVSDTLAGRPADGNHAADQRTIYVLNKTDLVGSADGVADVKTVATTGSGVGELRQLIRQRLGCPDLTPNRPRCWTSRQRNILTRALADQSALSEI